VEGLRRKRKTEATQKLLLLEVRKISVPTENKQKNTNPPLQPNQKILPSPKTSTLQIGKLL